MNTWSGCRVILLLLLSIGSVGCGKVELYSNLPEKDANEMMAILMQSGVSCAKAPGEEGTWNLKVAESDFAGSVATLSQAGYPRQSFENLGQVFQKSGLISSPLEEKNRLRHALQQELCNTLSRISGVKTVDVHIDVPDVNPFGDTSKPPSAAVSITHAPTADLQPRLLDIQEIVVATVEGLDLEHVKVIFSEAKDPFSKTLGKVRNERTEGDTYKLLGVEVEKQSLPMALVYLAGIAIAVVLATLVSRQILAQALTQGSSRGSKVES
ncbi:MAG: type III secretion inner membrane ring lipoprotein SctJ [Planctomycetota bacterium]